MVTSWIGYCLLISGALALAAYAGERALTHFGRPVRWMWVTAIAGSVVLPVIAFLAPAFVRAASPMLSADEAIVLLPALTVSAGAEAGATPVALSQILAWVWALMSLGLGLHLAGTYRRLRSEMREWTPGRILDAPVLVSDSRGPAVVGVRRAVIVMPGWVSELEDHLLRLIFLHEREHQRAGDHRLYALGTALLVIMPWNLFFWWQMQRLRLAIEFDCDRRVIDSGVDRREYADALLIVGSRVSSPLLAAAAFAERKPAVEHRLRRMTAPLARLRWPRAIGAAGVAALAIILVMGAPPPASVDEGPAAAAAPEADLDEYMTNPVESLPPPPAGGEANDRPSFIPYDTPPVLQNGQDVMEALTEFYPRHLKDAGVGGRIEIWLYVDEEGQVAKSEIKTASGNAALDEAALKVVGIMEFSPAQNRGSVTPVWVSQWVTFQVV